MCIYRVYPEYVFLINSFHVYSMFVLKEEYQTMIDSICECVPLSGIHFQFDHLHYESMTTSSKIIFTESQGGDRCYVEKFKSQADISRLPSDSDLVPLQL